MDSHLPERGYDDSRTAQQFQVHRDVYKRQVLNFFFLKTTVTLSPLSAFPHILTDRSRCNPIPSDRMAGNFTFASVHTDVYKRQIVNRLEYCLCTLMQMHRTK